MIFFIHCLMRAEVNVFGAKNGEGLFRERTFLALKIGANNSEDKYNI